VPAGADEDQHEVVVRATVSRLVLTIKALVEIVESVVRDDRERRCASARIQTFVPILTERTRRVLGAWGPHRGGHAGAGLVPGTGKARP
jgi:hypothetical protein